MNNSLTDIDARQLKLATRELLGQFDSLELAAAHCRVKPSNLSQYQNFDHTAFMPIDVAMALEAACGKTIVTRAMVTVAEKREAAATDRSVLDEALDIPVVVGEMLAFIQHATSPGSDAGRTMSENEKRRYFAIRQQLAQELDQLDVVVERDGTAKLPK